MRTFCFGQNSISIDFSAGKHFAERRVKGFSEKVAACVPKFFASIYPPKLFVIWNTLALPHFATDLRKIDIW